MINGIVYENNKVWYPKELWLFTDRNGVLNVQICKYFTQ